MRAVLDRRRFLGLSMSSGALGLAACGAGSLVRGAVPATSTGDEWSVIRGLFSLSLDRIHIAS